MKHSSWPNLSWATISLRQKHIEVLLLCDLIVCLFQLLTEVSQILFVLHHLLSKVHRQQLHHQSVSGCHKGQASPSDVLKDKAVPETQMLMVRSGSPPQLCWHTGKCHLSTWALTSEWTLLWMSGSFEQLTVSLRGVCVSDHGAVVQLCVSLFCVTLGGKLPVEAKGSSVFLCYMFDGLTVHQICITVCMKEAAGSTQLVQPGRQTAAPLPSWQNSEHQEEEERLD